MQLKTQTQRCRTNTQCNTPSGEGLSSGQQPVNRKSNIHCIIILRVYYTGSSWRPTNNIACLLTSLKCAGCVVNVQNIGYTCPWKRQEHFAALFVIAISVCWKWAIISVWTFWTCVHVSRQSSCVWSANALSWVPTCNNINFTQGCWLSGSLSAKYPSPLTRPFLLQWSINIYAARPRQLVKIKKECTNLTEEGGRQPSDQWNTKCNGSEILLSSKTNTERVHKLDRQKKATVDQGPVEAQRAVALGRL